MAGTAGRPAPPEWLAPVAVSRAVARRVAWAAVTARRVASPEPRSTLAVLGGVDCAGLQCARFQLHGRRCARALPPVCGPATVRVAATRPARCRFGTDTNACGRCRESCSNCTQSGQGCVGRCLPGHASATCGPANCGGCCDIGGSLPAGHHGHELRQSGRRGVRELFDQRPHRAPSPATTARFSPPAARSRARPAAATRPARAATGARTRPAARRARAASIAPPAARRVRLRDSVTPGTHCGPDNCAGCCTATGVCRPGNSVARAAANSERYATTARRNRRPVKTMFAAAVRPVPRPMPGCNPSSVTTPPFSSSSCAGAELQAVAMACAGSDPRRGLQRSIFQRLLQANPACYDCLLQFTGEDALVRCVAPYLTPHCNHDLTCAVDCSNGALRLQCPAGQSELAAPRLSSRAGSVSPGQRILLPAGGARRACGIFATSDSGQRRRPVALGVGRQYCAR